MCNVLASEATSQNSICRSPRTPQHVDQFLNLSLWYLDNKSSVLSANGCIVLFYLQPIYFIGEKQFFLRLLTSIAHTYLGVISDLHIFYEPWSSYNICTLFITSACNNTTSMLPCSFLRIYIFFREVLQQLLPAASPFMQYEYGSACGFASIRNKWYPRRPIKPLAK